MSITPHAAPQRWPFALADQAPAPCPDPNHPDHTGGACTPWFAGHLQPAQEGVYQRLNSLGRIVYSHWDGARWFWNRPSADLAATDMEPSLNQCLPWRGLAQPPACGYGQQPEGAPC